MAELIDKSVLSKDIVKRFGCRPHIEVGNKSEYIHTIIDEQPTTTEAEIRNKAIDEFFDELQRYEADDWLKLKMSSIYEIAEQLKGE